ncbi:MAG: aromatic ring-hydroxylating dioxygenase subunit alpha [Lacunisphaera sp.]|nr:aromatic ring-hydroxylating dioxygenase subunit alpha [Lacunisphaera sp.]
MRDDESRDPESQTAKRKISGPGRSARTLRRTVGGSSKDDDWIADLIAEHRPGFSLAQAFYTDPRIFERDMERVFLRQWVFAGHVSRVRNVGDYFLFTIGNESIAVIRGKDGNVHALFNVCRHRGSRICLEAEGNKRTLVCPYHAWTYATEGKLLAAPAMADGFDSSQFGLHKCHVRVVEGLIFICLGDTPPANEDAFRDWEIFLKPHGLTQAKIGKSMIWQVSANWKLVVENFGECYHCGPTHPEYCSVMAHALPDTHKANKHVGEFADLTAAWEAKAKKLGNLTGRVPHDLNAVHTCVRIPIKEGSLTASRDGRPVAPLMGSFADYDGGYTAGRLYPANYFVACCDHAVIPRFTPLSPQCTEVEMIWLVRGDALERKDYDLKNLTWLWKITTDQDKKIVDDNQAGVNSLAYQPGPYSQTEQGLARYTRWYLDQMQ